MHVAGAAVVVPMYNEEVTVGQVVDELRRAFDLVVCVDDGSTDSSVELARTAGATVLRHPINLGQGAALQTGFDFVLQQTDSRMAVTFDADGQHSVADAVAMVQRAAADGYDVVLGSRNLGSVDNQPLTRRLLLRAALVLSRRTTRLPLTDTHNGLRVLSRRALEQIRLTHAGMAYASELEDQISRRELHWTEHPVTITYTAYSRSRGQTNLNALNIVFDLAGARIDGTRC